MELVELTALALAPVVFLFTYVYLSDKYEREPLLYLVITFFLGVLVAFIISLGADHLNENPSLLPTVQTNWDKFLFYFVLVAVMEEGAKFLVLRFYNYPHKEFDEPYDGIMYGVAVALGFAAFENVDKVWAAKQAFENYQIIESVSFEVGVMRMFTAVPAHAMFGVLMGFFVGKAKFSKDKSKAWGTCLLGLFSAIFFHGVYDFLLAMESKHLTTFAFVSLGVGIILAKVAMHLHAEDSPHRYNPPSTE